MSCNCVFGRRRLSVCLWVYAHVCEWLGSVHTDETAVVMHAHASEWRRFASTRGMFYNYAVCVLVININ